MQVAGANEDILSGGAEGKGGELAPPPEVPAPQSLRAAPAPPPPLAAVPTPAPVVAPPPAKAATQPAAKPVPVVEKPAPAVEKPAPAVEKRAAPPAASAALVQLAAVSSEDAARSEWQRLSKRLPDLLSTHKPSFSKTEHDGRTLWRVRTGGFGDTAQATSFCEKVRAKGAACSVADF
jgi:outer membrane biosynthesis protein TonB